MSKRKVFRKPDEIGHQMAIRTDTVKNCKVCRLGHPLVGMVNRQILSGAPMMDVWRMLNNLHVNGNLNMEPPSYPSVRNHAQKHMSVHDDAIRRHLEMRAIEREIDIEEGVQNIITDIAVVENVMIMGHQEMVEGKSRVTIKDMLTAAKMKREFDREDADADEAEKIRAEMDLLFEAVKAVVPEQMYSQIVNKIDELARQKGMIDDTVVQAEAEDTVFVIPPDERFTS